MRNSKPTGEVPTSGGDGAPQRFWALDSELGADDRRAPAEFTVGLVTLGFVRAALRRSALVWCVTAAVGLLVGIAYFVARPPSYQATATVLLAPSTYPNEILDDQLIAESRTVAGAALGQLGLQENPDSLIRDSTITAPTDRILIITTKAGSSRLAVREANALAGAFLTLQAKLLNVQDELVTASMEQRIRQDQQRIDAMDARISSLSAEPASSAQLSQLASLKSQRTEAVSALTALKQANIANQASMQITATMSVRGSRVLDPAAPVVQSRLKDRLGYALIGLILGLALGAAFVTVRAVVSDRLRRRDDVALVLGAPVKLSVGKVRLRRMGREPAPTGRAEIRRIAAYLQRVLPARSPEIASLALVPVDDPQVAALSLVSLALDCAQDGVQVVVADLVAGSPAARLLAKNAPGVHEVRMEDAGLVVVVPDPDDVAPVGPLDRVSHLGWRDPANETLLAACSATDLLLTLAPLDPSVGGDYLAGWARSAVVVVTAGQARAERIRAVGEMVRQAGMRHVSAVLVGVDKTDRSLGTYAPEIEDFQSPRTAITPGGQVLPRNGTGSHRPQAR